MASQSSENPSESQQKTKPITAYTSSTKQIDEIKKRVKKQSTKKYSSLTNQTLAQYEEQQKMMQNADDANQEEKFKNCQNQSQASKEKHIMECKLEYKGGDYYCSFELEKENFYEVDAQYFTRTVLEQFKDHSISEWREARNIFVFYRPDEETIKQLKFKEQFGNNRKFSIDLSPRHLIIYFAQTLNRNDYKSMVRSYKRLNHSVLDQRINQMSKIVTDIYQPRLRLRKPSQSSQKINCSASKSNLYQEILKIKDVIEEIKIKIQKHTRANNAKSAFMVEYNVRELIARILEDLLFVNEDDIEQLRMSAERYIPIFDYDTMKERNDKKYSCRPDFEIMLKGEDVTLMIVEVKAIFKQDMPHMNNDELIYTKNQNFKTRRHSLSEDLHQMLKQLRVCCINEKKNYMVGVLTNSQEWIFTKYDMQSEMQRNLIEQEIKQLRTIYGNDSDGGEIDESESLKGLIGKLKEKWESLQPYEYSNTFKLFDFVENQDGHCEVIFNEEQFFHIYFILKSLKTCFVDNSD